MPISFEQIPESLRTSGAYIEFSPRATNLSELQRVLIIGEKTGGAIEPDKIVPVVNADDARTKFGFDSPLAQMVEAFKDRNNVADVYAVAVTDPDNPDIEKLLENMGEDQYHWIVNPYTQDAVLDALKVEMDDRWHAMSQNDGRVFMVFSDTYEASRAFCKTQNSPHFVTLPLFNLETEKHIALAIFAGVATYSLAIDPARPLQELSLPKIKVGANQPKREERNTLLYSGASTYTVQFDGTVQLERVITMYQRNAQGFQDDAYLDVCVPETLSRIRQLQRFTIMSKFVRFKLAKSAQHYGAGQRIVTPAMIKAELLALYKDTFMGQRGWVQNYDHYKDNCLVEIHPSDPDRVNFRDEPELIGQFRILAGQVNFKP